MLDRIENNRRLAEQCLRRARALRSKGEHAACSTMERWARDLARENASLAAQARLEAFAARVEG